MLNCAHIVRLTDRTPDPQVGEALELWRIGGLCPGFCIGVWFLCSTTGRVLTFDFESQPGHWGKTGAEWEWGAEQRTTGRSVGFLSCST